MSTSDSGREPSMEDILASIRKIIAEDPAPAAATGASAGEATQGSAPTPASSAPEKSEAATAAESSAASSPAPMSGRLADALGGLKAAASGMDPSLSSDTPKPRASSFGALDDDLADLLDDAPAATSPAAPTPAAQPAHDAAAAASKAAPSPFGSSFNPPAGLRAGRSADQAGLPRDEKPSAAPSSSHGEDDKSLPFGMKSDRDSAFSTDRLLKASSSLLGKSPDVAGKTSTARDADPALHTQSQAERPGDDTSRDDVTEPYQAKTSDTKAASETSGPVVIAAMPPTSKAGTASPDLAKAEASADHEPAQSTVQRASSPRPIGFALGAGSPPSGQSALEKTLGISHDAPAPSESAKNIGTQGFTPSLSGTDPASSSAAAKADDEVTEPILMPSTRDATADPEPLASTSALDELAAGLAASVGSVAGGASGNGASGGSSAAKASPPASQADQPPSANVTATAASPAVGATGRTLEETVGELLRPMLREWLDANMPHIVENALRAEMSESVSKSLSSGSAVPATPNVSGGFSAKKPN